LTGVEIPVAIACQHHLPGRMRVRIDSLKENRLMAIYLTTAAKSSPVFEDVHFSSRTGRALLYYNPTLNNPDEIIKKLSDVLRRLPRATAGGEGSRYSSIKAPENKSIPSAGKEPEDMPLKRQALNAGLGGLVLAVFSYRRITGKTSYLADSPGLFNIAAITAIIAGYPMFKSGLLSLTQKHRINHDVLLSTISIILILIRESIPGLTVVWLAGIISLLETLVLKAAANLSEGIAAGNSTAISGYSQQNTGSQTPEQDYVRNHPITASARTYGERMSTSALWLAALSGLKDRDPVRSLSILLASSPGAAGQAFPSSMAASVALASKCGIIVRNRQALAKAAGIKTVVFTHSSLLAPGFSLGSVLTMTGRTIPECLAAAEALAIRSEYYAGLFEKERLQTSSFRAQVRGSWRNVPKIEENGPVMEYTAALIEDTAAGVRGTLNGTEALLGSREFIDQAGISTQLAEYKVRRLNRFYQAPVFLALDGRLAAVLGVNRPVADRCRESLNRLRAMGVSPVLVTQEKIETVTPLKIQTGIDVMAGVPSEKIPDIIREFHSCGGTLAVVAESPEDGPGLSAADLSFVVPGADSSLIPRGDIIISTRDISKIPDTVTIGKRCAERAKQNLLLVMAFNLFGLAAASAGRFTPAGAAVYNNLASIAVAVNSLRLIAARD